MMRRACSILSVLLAVCILLSACYRNTGEAEDDRIYGIVREWDVYPGFSYDHMLSSASHFTYVIRSEDEAKDVFDRHRVVYGSSHFYDADYFEKNDLLMIVFFGCRSERFSLEYAEFDDSFLNVKVKRLSPAPLVDVGTYKALFIDFKKDVLPESAQIIVREKREVSPSFEGDDLEKINPMIELSESLEKYSDCSSIYEVYEHLMKLDSDDYLNDLNIICFVYSNYDIEIAEWFAYSIYDRINEFSEKELADMVKNEEINSIIKTAIVDCYEANYENKSETGIR